MVIIYVFMIVLMYFLAGINKMKNFSSTVSGLKTVFPMKKLPMIFYKIVIVLVILIEVLSPIFILYATQTGYLSELAYYSTISLAIFTVLATLLYHFPPNKPINYYPFMKNLTATGGLLLLSSNFM